MPECHVCGKGLEEGEGFEHPEGKQVCCDSCKSHYDREKKKGKEDEEIEKGEVCEFC